MKRLILILAIFLLTVFFSACTSTPVETDLSMRSPSPSEIFSTRTGKPSRPAPIGENFTATPSLTPTITPYPTLVASPAGFTRAEEPFKYPEEPITIENAHAITELARWGLGSIEDIQFSPDDLYFFVQTTQGIFAYDSNTYEEIWRYLENTGVVQMALQPVDKYLALGTRDGRIVLLERATGELIIQWQAHSNDVLALAFSSDGQVLASAETRIFKLWSYPDIQMTFEYRIGWSDDINQLGFSESNKTLVLRHEDKVEFYNLETGSFIRRDDVEYHLVFSNDYKYVTDGYRVWETETGELLYKLKHGDVGLWGFSAVAFSPDNAYIAVGFVGESFVDVWRLSDETRIYRLDSSPSSSVSPGILAAPIARSGPGPGGVFGIAFTPDSKTLIADTGSATEFWDLESGTLKATMSAGGALLISKSGELLLAWFDDGFDVVNVKSRKVVHSVWDFTAGSGWWGDLFISPDGDLLFVGSEVWDLLNAKMIDSLGDDYVINFSSDGHLVYTFSSGSKHLNVRRISDLKIVDVIYASSLKGFPGGDSSFNPFISPTGEYLTSNITIDSAIGIYTWDLKTNSLIDEISTFETYYGIQKALYSSDSSLLVLMEWVGFKVWQLKPEIKLIDEFSAESEGVNQIALSKDDNYLAVSSGMDKLTIYLIDRDKGLEKLSSWTTKDDRVTRLAFSPESTILAFATSDSEIGLLEVASGELLMQIDGYFEPIYGMIYGLAFSPDGLYLAATSWDGTVRLWGIAP